MKNQITAELLPNGFYRLFCYGSKLSGLYHQDGTHHAGSLILNKAAAAALISDEIRRMEAGGPFPIDDRPTIDEIANTIRTETGPHWIIDANDPQTITYEEGAELKTIRREYCRTL